MPAAKPAPVPASFPYSAPAGHVAVEIPGWASATIVYRDDDGEVCGFGFARRTAEAGFELELSTDLAVFGAGPN